MLESSIGQNRGHEKTNDGPCDHQPSIGNRLAKILVSKEVQEADRYEYRAAEPRRKPDSVRGTAA